MTPCSSTTPSQWATATQLCTKYQVSRTTWWRWSKAADFPAPARYGHTVRWHTEAVDAFLTGQGEAT